MRRTGVKPAPRGSVHYRGGFLKGNAVPLAAESKYDSRELGAYLGAARDVEGGPEDLREKGTMYVEDILNREIPDETVLTVATGHLGIIR
jgi:hypothetical protein